VTLPASGTAAWADSQCWPANLHMVLPSNASHLAAESVRHLVADNAGVGFTLGAKDTTWDDLIDSTAPSPTDLAAATPVYRRVSWAPLWTLNYGPFHAICDRKSEGLFVQRKIKMRITYSTSGPGTSLIVCVLTTHDSPRGINEGDVLAYNSVSLTGAVSGSFDSTFDVGIQDRPFVPWFCRSTSSARGATYVSVAPLYLWVCVESKDGCTIRAVSAWEVR